MKNPEYEGDTETVQQFIHEAAQVEHTNSGVATALHALRSALSDYRRYKRPSDKAKAWVWVKDQMARVSCHLSGSDAWKEIQERHQEPDCAQQAYERQNSC